MPLIFVIDGVLERGSFARTTLERAGCTVKTFATAQVLKSAEQQVPDLALVALKLPDGSGIDLLSSIRSSHALSQTRVVLIANVDEFKTHAAPELADGFLRDNFTASELIYRVDATLNHVISMPRSPALANDAEILIDSSAMRVKVLGNELTTTTLEFRLIEYMARHRGKVFTRDALLDAVWGDLHFVNPRTVDACVGRIRRKIGNIRYAPTYLKTIRGVGYKLDAKAAWESAANQFCDCPSCAHLRARETGASGSPSSRTSA